MLPTALNETADDVLFIFVDDVVTGDGSGTENLQPLAPFVTLELLRRVHERVVHLKHSHVTMVSKHKLLARAILCLTGMAIPPDVSATSRKSATISTCG